MKKFILIFMSFTILLFSAIGCGKNGDLTIVKVNEVTDSFFYAPFYVAIEKGFFEEN